MLRSLEHKPAVRAGAKATVTVVWENVGVAPPYRDYRVALQLRRSDDVSAKPVVIATDTSIRGWLPGIQRTELGFQTPESLPLGRYQLAIGLVAPTTQIPAVRLAIAGRDVQGWYPISELDLDR